MKLKNVYGLNIYKLKWQVFSMAVFVLLTVVLMLQKHMNLTQQRKHQRIAVTTDIFCITEVCLNDDCIQVPGAPVEGKVIIEGEYNNKQVKHILVITYPGHKCGGQH